MPRHGQIQQLISRIKTKDEVLYQVLNSLNLDSMENSQGLANIQFPQVAADCSSVQAQVDALAILLNNHKGRHITGGADSFLGTDLIDALVKRVRSVTADLIFGTIADGDYLKRDGVTIIGDTPAGGGGGSIYPAFTVPTVADFTTVNFGGSTATDLPGSRGVYMYSPSNGSAQNYRLLTRALPASSGYHVDVGIMPLQFRDQYSIVTFGLYDSGTGKFVDFEFINGGGAQQIYYRSWTNVTTNSGTYWGPIASDMMPWPLIFLKFEDDGANRILSWASDGESYLPIYSQGRTTHMTPDRAFVGTNPYDQATGVTIKHWFQA